MSTVEKTYEMQWDCEYCGAKKLLGLSQRYCPTCGGPQNPAKRYFPAESDKVAVEDHPFVGADATCPACRHAMSRACNNCSNCGSPIDAGKQVAMHGGQQQGAGGQWQPAESTEARGGASASKRKIGLIVGLIVMALVVLVVARTALKKDAVLSVVRHSWMREITIERFDEVEEQGACRSVPAEGRILSRTTPEPKCTMTRVDKGDGTFKETKACTEPAELCTYRIDKWKAARTAKETGGLESAPTWPALNLRLGNCRGCERTAAKTESYTVGFDDAQGKPHDCEVTDVNRWKGFAKGAKFGAQIRVVGGDLDCDSLKAK